MKENNIEEDIEAIEKFIARLNLSFYFDETTSFGFLQKPLENLIKAYRELEEKQQSYNTAYNQGKAFENHKWKSKVKELIQKESFGVYIKPNGIIKVIQTEALKELMEDK